MTQTSGQQLAVRQLADIEAARPGALEVLGAQRVGTPAATLRIEVSLNLAGVVHAPGGIRVRARERFLIDVDSRFPYTPPSVCATHRRWAEAPHVHWGRLLCLFAAPAVEWQPGDGMRGLIERLLLWVEKAAIGELDPDDRPRHPPVAYRGDADEYLVVRADVGDRVPWRDGSTQSAVYAVGVCEQRGDRLDVVAWHTPDEFERLVKGGWPAGTGPRISQLAVAAVLVDGELGFEYPTRARDLAAGLYNAGVQHDAFMELIALVASTNATSRFATPSVAPLIVMVGTPSRHLGHGPRLAHLVGWRLDSFAEEVADLLTHVNELDAPDLRQQVLNLGESWLGLAKTNWLGVLEDRPEVTVRRDADSSATWLTGKRVIVLGCGAVGAPAAEFCVRAGASTVTVVDKGTVTPGVLVRQPYIDEDIGTPKAKALAERLNRITRNPTVQAQFTDVIASYAAPGREIPPADLIIDATADAGVRAALEVARVHAAGTWPPVLTLLVGHRARRGVVALARREATGSAHDILRRLGLAVNGPHHRGFADIADDFYPDPPRTTSFQPEPGCSSPTFVGSAAEVTALAGMMITAAFDALAGRGPARSQQPMAAAAVRLGAEHPGTSWLGWPNDLTIAEQNHGYQVRFSRPALAEMRAEVRRGARVRGERVETGGMLLGAIDEAVQCIFVDAATGPTPDSRLSEPHFEHGVAGAQAIVDYHRTHSHRASGFVGMWHTHPYGVAATSPTDAAGMAGLVTPISGGPPRALMLILAGSRQTWTAWRDHTRPDAHPDLFARLVRGADRYHNGRARPAIPAPPHAIYFPGGYAIPTLRRPPTGHLSWWRRIVQVVRS